MILYFFYTENIFRTRHISGQVGGYQQSHRLYCRHPSATFWLWYYNGSRLYFGQVKKLEDGTLYFPSLRFKDAGEYICHLQGKGNPLWVTYLKYDLSVNGKHSSSTCIATCSVSYN